MLARFLLRWFFNGVALTIATQIIPGLRVPDAAGVITAALVLGLVNAFIRPVVLLVTLPVNLLTLGLFTLVVNAVMLYLVAALTSLEIASFGSAFLGALLIAIISTGLSHIAGR